MYELTNQQFTDDFINKFSEDGFYAAPNRTKIYIYFNGKRKLLGNAIVANLEQVYEKIPVYSYNSPLYNKYLKGKEVITGVLALRKITVAQFISMQKTELLTSKIKVDIDKLKKELERLKNLFDPKINLHGLNKIIAKKSKLLTELRKIEEKINKNKEENIDKNEQIQSSLRKLNKVFYEMEGIRDKIDQSIFDKDDLLYHLDNKENKINIEVLFEGNLGDICPYIGLKDVLFTKKRTEINVSRGDVVEVYEFIGNPKQKLG